MSNRYKRYGFRNYYNPSNIKVVLPSGHSAKSAFLGLKKAWLGFKIAKSKDDNDKMIYHMQESFRNYRKSYVCQCQILQVLK
jgi:hypothetical protein